MKLTINPESYPVIVEHSKVEKECKGKWKRHHKEHIGKKVEIVRSIMRGMLPEIVDEVRKSVILEKNERPQMK